MPAMNNGNFYSAAGGQRSGGSKQSVFLGIGILVVIVATYMTYQYFTKGAGQNAPVVRTEEAPGTKPVTEAAKDTLPQEAQDVRDAVRIFTAIADKSPDTEFFKDEAFQSLKERVINIPEAFPPRGRIFELWTAPSGEAKPTTSIQPPPPPSTGGAIRIRR
jgi:CO dehydrogenase/acetyl-CoA synthase beta subunit